MTQDEIIKLAREAGFYGLPVDERLERFAALVEQRVRSELALDELAKISQELGGY